MKSLIALIALLAGTQASALSIENCAQNGGVNLNNVVEMRTYSNGGVKLFAVDQIEPAAASFGVAVTIDRGGDLSEMESFCRYVSGLSGVDLAAARSSYDRHTNLLTLEIPARYYRDDQADFVPGVLTLVINKGAKSESGLVSAVLK
jgi:hypothetical protein